MITVKEIAKAVSEIIFANEGNYASVNRDDNGAMSIGKLQWHGERARDLLSRICADEPALQAELGTLWSEVVGGSFRERTLDEAEVAAVRSVLESEKSKNIQDTLAIEDICLDIERGVSYGLSNCGALMYFADGANQYGRYSKLWRDAVELALLSGGTLDALHSAVLSLATSRLERRARTYEKIKKTELAACYLGEEKDTPTETAADTDTDTVLYTVERGDTLSAIAKKYGSDVDRIVEANREKYKRISRDYIECGWTIEVPLKKEKNEYEQALAALEGAGVLGGGVSAEETDEGIIIMLYRLMQRLTGGAT